LQLATLFEVDTALRSEYALRRRMLIERAKVTLQSFLWSPRLLKKVRVAACLHTGCTDTAAASRLRLGSGPSAAG
jgi:hypothetical protein